MLDVGEIKLPCRSQIHKVPLVGLAAITIVRSIEPLVAFALVPQRPADAMRQVGCDHTLQQVAINRAIGRIQMIGWIGHVLINPCAADGPVQDADRHTFVFHQLFGKRHTPGADKIHAVGRLGRQALNHGVPPASAKRVPCFTITAKAAYPRAAVVGEFRTVFLIRVVVGHGIGLPVDDVGVAAHEVGDRIQHRLGAAALRPELDFVFDQPGLDFEREGVGFIRCDFLAFSPDELVIGVELHEHGVSGVAECAVVNQRTLILVVTCKELVVDRFLLLARRPLHPRIFRRFLNHDLARLRCGCAAIAHGCCHGQLAAVIGAQEGEFSGRDILDDRHA